MRAFWTKLFIPQRRLKNVVADLPELLAQPATVLARREIRIGPLNRCPGLLAAIFVGLAMTILHSLNWQVGLAAGAVLAVLVWLGCPRGEIRLTADDVVFQDGRRAVRCPWALFNTVGNPSLKNQWHLALPVSPAAVPYVELREDEYFRAQGAAVKTRFFRFVGGDTLWLRSSYEVYSAEIGELLLRLGRMLGNRSPSGWAPPEAHPAESVRTDPIGVVGAEGTIALRVTRLFFPPVCCACGQATHQWRNFPASVRWGTLLAFLGGGHVHPPFVDIPLPMCASCQERFRRVVRRGAWLGLFAGLLFAVQLGVLAMTPKGIDDVFMVMFAIALFVGLRFSGLAGTALARRRRSPIRSARYSARRGIVRLRFRRADYAALVAESIRAVETKT